MDWRTLGSMNRRDKSMWMTANKRVIKFVINKKGIEHNSKNFHIKNYFLISSKPTITKKIIIIMIPIVTRCTSSVSEKQSSIDENVKKNMYKCTFFMKAEKTQNPDERYLCRIIRELNSGIHSPICTYVYCFSSRSDEKSTLLITGHSVHLTICSSVCPSLCPSVCLPFQHSHIKWQPVRSSYLVRFCKRVGFRKQYFFLCHVHIYSPIGSHGHRDWCDDRIRPNSYNI